ncbi:hypothetical protein FRC08_016088 [Ceratobasidium sp. 394]|nr:hypothetical protein FRC08_016088 [Ceratobasidium sp. 394]
MYVYYLTKEDESCVPIRKRLIATLRSLGKLTEATEELTKYLDTFYADVEGWMELADIYAECNLYDRALSALAHAQLLAPQTPQVALCSAETAYAAGDVALALKTFLRAAELCGSGPNTPLEGVERRAWFGVKLVGTFFFLSVDLPPDLLCVWLECVRMAWSMQKSSLHLLASSLSLLRLLMHQHLLRRPNFTPSSFQVS